MTTSEVVPGSGDRRGRWLPGDALPDPALGRSAIHATAVAGLAAVFAYQGVVPKLWKVDRADVAIWSDLGFPDHVARVVVRAVGAVEAGFALATVVRSDKRWPFAIAIATMPILAIGTGTANRSTLTSAFNPVSLGAAVVALGVIALGTRADDRGELG